MSFEVLLANPRDPGDSLVQRSGRITTLRGGLARGRLLGGNLAVLSSMAGSPYWPAFDGAILVLEDVNEYIYRVDRMLSTLKNAGVLTGLPPSVRFSKVRSRMRASGWPQRI